MHFDAETVGTVTGCRRVDAGLLVIDHLIISLLRSLPAMVLDKTSFCRFINEGGRAYQYQAIELITICRVFSTASYQSPDQDIRLQRYSNSPGLWLSYPTLMFLPVCSRSAIWPLSMLSTHTRRGVVPQISNLTRRFASYMSMGGTSTLGE